MNSLVVANIERNELRNKTRELEEELQAKKTALKQISRENAELKGRMEMLMADNTGQSVIRDLSGQVEELKENLQTKQAILQDINRENQELRAKMDQGNSNETSQLEQLRGSLEANQKTLEELSKQNNQLLAENTSMKQSLAGLSGDAVPSGSLEVGNLQELLKTLSLQNEELKAQIATQSSSQDNNQQALKIQELSSRLWEKDNEIKKLMDLKTKLEGELEGTGSMQKDLEDQMKRSSELEAEVANLTLQVAQLEDKSGADVSQVENLKVNLQLKQETLEQLGKQNEELRERVSAFEASDMKGLLEESYRKLQELSEDLSSKTQELGRLQKCEEDAKASRGKIQELEQVVFSLKQSLAAAEDNSMSDSSQMENLKENLVLKQQTVAQLNQDNEELHRKLAAYQMSESEKILLQVTQEKVQKLAAELSDKERQNELLQSLNSQLEQSKVKADELEGEVKRLQMEIAALEDNSQSESSLMENLKENLKLKQQTVEQLNTDNETVRADLQGANRKLTELSEQLTAKENDLQLIIGERDQKFIQMMDKFAEKEGELEDLKKDNEDLQKKQQQSQTDVSITGGICCTCHISFLEHYVTLILPNLNRGLVAKPT